MVSDLEQYYLMNNFARRWWAGVRRISKLYALALYWILNASTSTFNKRTHTLLKYGQALFFFFWIWYFLQKRNMILVAMLIQSFSAMHSRQWTHFGNWLIKRGWSGGFKYDDNATISAILGLPYACVFSGFSTNWISENPDMGAENFYV